MKTLRKHSLLRRTATSHAIGLSLLSLSLSSVLAPIAETQAAPPTITFRDTYRRYLAGRDLFRMLAQKFPLGVAATTSFDCTNINDNNKGFLGTMSPVTGTPSAIVPASAYIRWYSKCASGFIQSQLTADIANPNAPKALFAGWAGYLGPQAVTLLQASTDTALQAAATNPASMTWMKLSDAVKSAVLYNLVDGLVGPGVLKDEPGLVARVLAEMSTVDPTLTAQSGVQQAILRIVTKDEFLTF